MNERSKSKDHNTDFSAARARLKDIGEGLGGVFDTMSKLIEEAARQDTSKTPRDRVKSTFDVRVTSLDDLSAAKRGPSAARNARVNPNQAQRAKAQPEKTRSPKPLAVELHETADTLVIVVTLGAVAGEAITVRQDAEALVLEAPHWRHRLSPAEGALDSAALANLRRVERNGFLTLYLQRRSTPSTQATETQE